MMQQIWDFFSFSEIEIIGLSLFFLFFIFQLFYYWGYYKKPYRYVQKIKTTDTTQLPNKPKVSVIIVAKNETDNLAINLPSILNQDYPDFEVIVVNDGSTDESDDLLKSLSQTYPHLYQTYLPLSNDRLFGRRKLAFTLGAKAAKGDVLLFTEAYCKPISNQWIAEMVASLSDPISVVLGYSYYTKKSGFFNRVARFDNLFFGMHYLALAIKGKPFMGVYRNIAFQKHLFFDNKGFSSHLNLENGEDSFLNQIITAENTTVALGENSFVEAALDGFAQWKQIKEAHASIKTHFEGGSTLLSFTEILSRYGCYILFLALSVDAALYQNWLLLGITIVLFLARLSIQLITIHKVAQYFRAGIFCFSLVLLDFIQPIYNFRFDAFRDKQRPRGR